MNQERKLYPMRICSILDSYAWGDEEFKLADLGYRDSLIRDGWLAGNSISEIMDTYMDRIVGDSVYESLGRQFPFQVKVLRCSGRLPLTVHPGDELASQRYDFLGKEKLWLVLDAGKDAVASIGFRRDTDASELCARCQDGSVEEILNGVALHEGQSFLIHPGTVHSLSGHVTVLEVSESSPLDFCLCSWGQELSDEEYDPELNLVEALDFIDYKAFRADEVGISDGFLADLRQFSLRIVEPDGKMKMTIGESGSCLVYTCLSGEASVSMEVLGVKAETLLAKGETVLVPAEVEEFDLAPLKDGTTLVEVRRRFFAEEDSYLKK